MEEYLYGEDGGMDERDQRDGCNGFNGRLPIQSSRSQRTGTARIARNHLRGKEPLSSFPRCQGGEERFHGQGRQLLYHHGSQHGGQEYLPPFIGRELYLSDGRNACLCRPSEDFPLQNVLQHENYRRPDAWHLLLQCRTDPTGRTVEILQG